MRIPSNSAQPRPPERSQRPVGEGLQSEGVATAGDNPRVDRIDLSDGARGSSPTERVAAFVEGVHARLAAFARGLDPDQGRALAEALAAFDGGVDRIQDALREGTLGLRGLSNALEGILQGLQRDLSGLGGEGDPAPAAGGRARPTDRGGDASTQQRIEAFGETVADRLEALAASGLSERELQGLRAAQSSFAHGLGRIEQALAGEGLGARGLQAALDALLAGLREDLGALLSPPSHGAELYDARLGLEFLGGGADGLDRAG